MPCLTRYAQTFLLLQRYDEGLLTEPRTVAGGNLPSLNEARAALADLKSGLMTRGEATAIFAQERGDGLSALLGNLDQSAFGEPAYPSVESKAAPLLYFVIKNHPFIDGNKRSGAFLFVDFLNRNGRLLDPAGNPVINDIGLAALALLVAESDPAERDDDPAHHEHAGGNAMNEAETRAECVDAAAGWGVVEGSRPKTGTPRRISASIRQTSSTSSSSTSATAAAPTTRATGAVSSGGFLSSARPG